MERNESNYNGQESRISHFYRKFRLPIRGVFVLAAQYVDIMTPRLLLLLRLRLPGLDPAPTSHLTGTAGIREIREEALEVRRHQSQGWGGPCPHIGCPQSVSQSYLVIFSMSYILNLTQKRP